VEEEHSLPLPKDMEAVSSTSLSGWSSSDEDSKRNLEYATTETPKDFPRLEWWEEAEQKAKEEGDEMLKEREALLESFTTAYKEERTHSRGTSSVQRGPNYS
jgi:hypothetical protein